MNYEERDVLILQILSTKHLIAIDNTFYIFKQPSLELQHEAERFYADLEYEISFDGLLTKKDVEKILIKLGLWKMEYNIRIQQIEEEIENLKVKLFQAIFRSKEREQIRRSIERLYKELEFLLEKKHTLDYATREQFLKTLKLQYAIALSIYDKNDKQIYEQDSLLQSDNYIISKVIEYLSEHKLTHAILRELARTEPWRSHWSIGKEKVFSCSVSDLTDEQRALALFSRMYDSAYNHPECPDEETIKDDYAFDGWLILQDRQRKKAVAQKVTDKFMSKHRGAQEIMIPAETIEDARKITSMNSLESQIDLKMRQAALAKRGKLDEIHLPDVQRKLKQEAVKKYTNTVKKGR